MISGFTDLTEAIGWRAMRISLGSEYSEKLIGSCSLFGDNDFRDTMEKAFQRLEGIDEAIHAKITDQAITFVGPIKGKPYFRQINRRFCIHNWMLEHSLDAVIYGIVTSFYVDSEFEASGRMKNRFLRKEPFAAYRLTAEWLKRFSFDEVYIEQMVKAGREVG
ncbi:hypothetical protein MLD52_22350 [Puniceicoccaceae bacterium K14]|nr:hypothetical protein [Puniceicoccaceae bacterium K14]